MSGLFKSSAPNIQMPEPQAPPPTIDTAAVAREEADRGKRRRRGRASQMLTGDSGAGAPNSAVKTLTGE